MYEHQLLLLNPMPSKQTQKHILLIRSMDLQHPLTLEAIESLPAVSCDTCGSPPISLRGSGAVLLVERLWLLSDASLASSRSHCDLLGPAVPIQSEIYTDRHDFEFVWPSLRYVSVSATSESASDHS